jgi:hypothetical protein
MPTPAAVASAAPMIWLSCAAKPSVSSAFIGGPAGRAVTVPFSSRMTRVPLPPTSMPRIRPGRLGTVLFPAAGPGWLMDSP